VVTLTNAWSVDDAHAMETLRDAEMEELRLIYDSSNHVFLATLVHPQHGQGLGVYKPAQGERPLHDFSYGTLHLREVAAYHFATLLGWTLIPPTVARDGPRGPGSLQLFIEHDPSEHYFTFRGEEAMREQLIRFAAFDLLVNNADRKGGHLLRDADGRLWGIDNALCFHQLQKVRTVIWDFSGERLSEAWVADIERARDCLESGDESTETLRSSLSARELEALVARCAALSRHPVLPEMFAYRCVPWPLI